MKMFNCDCGRMVFFENTQCTTCHRKLGFDPESFRLLSFEKNGTDTWLSSEHQAFKECLNGKQYNVCNWMIPARSSDTYCLACNLNEMVPAIAAPKKRLWWSNMEIAKRRLLYTLLRLNLPIVSRKLDSEGIAFAFLEDKRINPNVKEEIVSTGHAQGLITVYLAEADDVSRELARVKLGENYRTLLGHFRHESGHYYFDRILKNSEEIWKFRDLFGDETQDYKAALKKYYSEPPPPAWQTDYISDYAQSHPLEDWAECWAHYLHVIDTLETATEFSIVDVDPFHHTVDEWLGDWDRVTVVLNALNRSMGMRDAYPFVYSNATIEKIRFVHSIASPMRRTN
ncbi:zinc-binding metallopeptidase family protein [Aurantivibrio infirmus]